MRDTTSIDKCLARQLSSIAMDCLAPSLEGEKYYQVEDHLTEIFNNVIWREIEHTYWKDKVIDSLECLDLPAEEIENLCDDDEFVDSIVDEITTSNAIYDNMWEIIDWHINRRNINE